MTIVKGVSPAWISMEAEALAVKVGLRQASPEPSTFTVTLLMHACRRSSQALGYIRPSVPHTSPVKLGLGQLSRHTHCPPKHRIPRGQGLAHVAKKVIE